MMIELIEQIPQPILSIRTKTSIDKLPQMIGINYMKIIAYMERFGAQPASAPFTAYHNLDMQDMDVEMGFPLEAPLPGEGEIAAGELQAGKIVTSLYKGPYSGMQAIYDEIFMWIAENKLEPTGVYYEYYLNSPDEAPESEMLTKIVIPVK